MEIIKQGMKLDFMGKRKLATLISAVLIVISLFSLMTLKLNPGIDFTGGTLIEVGYSAPAELSRVRSALEQAGFGEAIVQHFGTAQDVLIRLAPREGLKAAELSSEVLKTLQTTGEVSMRRVEFVGPQVGDELAEDGGLAVLFSLFAILIYVALRFEYRFSVGAVAALVHDVILTLGIFSLLQIEFDLTVLAAILAVIGYSLNDTIVVFDRIRENFRKLRKGTPVEVINFSLNQTLSRTLMTSVTTLIVLLALFFLGGEIIHGFALALIIGVVVGTYSSIYVASSTTLALGISKEDLMPPQKEGAEQPDSVV
ncbi:MAG: protein translocase subunit SecF [Gammaproteobacteria bacterium]|jgi:preprotein translocase subunit SecF|nr:protein translocase subunit SecF [Gammaproteobacteria bacterium]MBT3488989.1 protein translocase subunit SecF [Gammaproteobacteria bacterium]MBT3717443.1 protein translocase subunit SecF [Gammaproteobacteria bacterium]MBT3844611.1 protein translocase subunit SecF [Gammaproteobacteria bacterium]MBT3892780.1 protein translocase subunit SecF [Gammaproteobacteria bacterium]